MWFQQALLFCEKKNTLLRYLKSIMFLPVNKQDMLQRGWSECDFIYVIGDAYVDHPSFGFSIISRVLESHGFKVGIIAQPDVNDLKSITILGKPRLAFLVSSGNLDSIVNNYTVNKKRRESDSYSEGGCRFKRPDYAVNVYCNMIKKAYKEVPIIIGGIEASLRRLAHYDYLKDTLLESILISSGADIISYGMGEKIITEIAFSLDSGLKIENIIYLPSTVWKTSNKDLLPNDSIMLPSFEEIKNSKISYAKSFNIQYNNLDPFSSKALVEKYEDTFVVQNVPQMPFEEEYLDWVYSLPFERCQHPMYKKEIPALKEVKFSIAMNRGCMGSCSFCALSMHQGRIIQSRSKESIVNEAKILTRDSSFKGYIHDIGGPTANFYEKACKKQETNGACPDKKCLFPKKCPALNVTHKKYLDILNEVKKLDNVKKVFIRSGIRYDYLIYDKDEAFFEELVRNHISGQLKVAPEHVSNKVLSLMQKPSFEVYEKFEKRYYELNKKYGKNQFLIPYLMSSHPGSTLDDAITLSLYLKKKHLHIKQVQDFYPTPGTLSTAMYYTGLDPRTMEKVYVAKSKKEKAMQRALIQYYDPKNYNIIYDALKLAKREDLIGNHENCLIKNKKNIQK